MYISKHTVDYNVIVGTLLLYIVFDSIGAYIRKKTLNLVGI